MFVKVKITFFVVVISSIFNLLDIKCLYMFARNDRNIKYFFQGCSVAVNPGAKTERTACRISIIMCVPQHILAKGQKM